ncbi:hypothetical protein YC2023_108027 [Brassica napus]
MELTVGEETAQNIPFMGIFGNQGRLLFLHTSSGQGGENTQKETEWERRRELAGGPIRVSVGDRRSGENGGKGTERERDRQIRTGILGQTTVQASSLDTGPPCSNATGSDPYTNGSRLGCREMVPESDGLILRILPDGRRVLTQLIRRVLRTA